MPVYIFSRKSDCHSQERRFLQEGDKLIKAWTDLFKLHTFYVSPILTISDFFHLRMSARMSQPTRQDGARRSTTCVWPRPLHPYLLDTGRGRNIFQHLAHIIDRVTDIFAPSLITIVE